MTKPSATQFRIIWFALTTLAVVAIIAVIVVAVWGFGEFLNLLSPVLWPLAIAAVLAYLLDPPVNWLEHHKFKRPWAIATVFAAGTCVFGGILASVIPQMIKESNDLIAKIPNYVQHAQQKIQHLENNGVQMANKMESTNSPEETNLNFSTNSTSFTNFAATTNLFGETNSANAQTNSAATSTNSVASGGQFYKQIFSSAQNWMKQAVPQIGSWFLNLLTKAGALIDIAIAIILIPIYTYYFLREKRGIESHWKNYLPMRDSRVKDEIIFILSSINQYMIAFFRGQVLVALISGALYTIGFVCIGLDYAFLFGVIAVILVFIPFIGAILLCGLAVFFTAVQFHDIFHPLMILILFAVVQSLESFLYTPRIMGNRINLHPVMVIIALMIGVTLLGGLLGGLLAIPLAAALRVLLFRYVWKKNEMCREKV